MTTEADADPIGLDEDECGGFTFQVDLPGLSIISTDTGVIGEVDLAMYSEDLLAGLLSTLHVQLDTITYSDVRMTWLFTTIGTEDQDAKSTEG